MKERDATRVHAADAAERDRAAAADDVVFARGSAADGVAHDRESAVQGAPPSSARSPVPRSSAHAPATRDPATPALATPDAAAHTPAAPAATRAPLAPAPPDAAAYAATRGAPVSVTADTTRRALALATPVTLRRELSYFASVVLQTAINDLKRINAYFIDVIRWPLFPLSLFAVYQLSYRIAGRSTVEQADAVGFLLVGMVGMIIWSTTLWSGGYAIEMERSSGTAAALFLSPASRVAVILGYGFGGLVWGLPAIAMVAVLSLLTGARFDAADPLALAAALGALVLSSLASGFALAGLFILSRRANMMANFLQTPIYLLAGFVVPRDTLPWYLRAPSDVLPISHAVDALRATALRGATLADAAPALALALLTAIAFVVIGIFALGRVESVAKHRGELDLY